jgi:hypothetical protein
MSRLLPRLAAEGEAGVLPPGLEAAVGDREPFGVADEDDSRRAE